MKILHKLVVVTTALFGFPSLLYFKNDKSNQSRNERYVWQRDSKVLPPLSIPQTYDMPEENLHIQNQVEYQASPPRNKSIYRIKPSDLLKARVIYNLRQSMRTDLQGFNISWQKDHIPDFGGKPIRNIIVSTWRSGSTFLAELVSSHPGTLLIFEPFMYMESERIRTKAEVSNGITMSKSSFNCYFNYTEWTGNGGNFISGMISRSDKMKPFCTIVPDGCRDPEFISKVCTFFPIQLVKFVRFRLKDAEELLSDEEYDTRLIYLVRDPRGTMKSRNNGSNYWCDQHPDCSDERRLCSDLVDEFADAKKFKGKIPQALQGPTLRRRFIKRTTRGENDSSLFPIKLSFESQAICYATFETYSKG
ncbi:carbohydrate sulfotransferase 6-like [Folsomia candida]|uniref:carbohydrate sulfotransferase 6-like n=1 Tax=Folsomia candida TaxID=158441 RepID=UPI001604D31F|nr:carbohydrate sulfotransferase 6-like [Folsomia candida]